MNADNAREDAAAESLVEQSDLFTLRALEAVNGARGDVANLALLTAAFAAARHYVSLQVPADDVESRVTKLIELATESAREYSKVLVEDGTIRFSETVRTLKRSDAEMRVLKIPSEGRDDG